MLNATPHTFVGTTTFTVAGMTCGHCERAVADEIGRVAGVQAVTVDFASGSVSVTTLGAVDRADIAAAVEEAGYILVP